MLTHTHTHAHALHIDVSRIFVGIEAFLKSHF